MSRFRVTSCVATGLLLSACSRSAGLPPNTISSGASIHGSTAVTQQLIPGRSGPPAAPNPLVAYNGKLYASTERGGTYNGGVIFSLTPAGHESTIFQFKAAGVPGGPNGGLDLISGTLYGTAYDAGQYRGGRFFGVSAATGKLVYEHDFGGGQDGYAPSAGPIDDGQGTLYGTTWSGGAAGYGTIYSVNVSTKKETVLYSFAGGSDGKFPSDRLALVNGTLYGTTFEGGAGGGLCGCGTVFAYKVAGGKETVLHSFQAGSDGAQAGTGVTYVNGFLYGSAFAGGSGAGCQSFGCGVVYRVDATTGTETVLHAFSAAEGNLPNSDLTLYNGKLYGTTTNGPTYNGSIFSVDPKSGKVTTLYYFKASDGGSADDLTVYGRHLYGNAQTGGKNGDGVVFRYDPPSSLTPIYNF